MENKNIEEIFLVFRAMLIGSIAGIVMITLIGYLLTSKAIRDLEAQIDKQSDQIEELSAVMNDHFDRIDSELDELSVSVDNLSSEVSKLEENVSSFEASMTEELNALENYLKTMK